MELQCELDTNPSLPIIVSFEIQPPSSTLCTLEPNNRECQNTSDPCITRYSASCPSTTKYSIQVTVSSNWNDVFVVCQSLYKKSNSVVFFVEGRFMIWFKSLNMVNSMLSRNNNYNSNNGYKNLLIDTSEWKAYLFLKRVISSFKTFSFESNDYYLSYLFPSFNHHSYQEAYFCVH